MNKIKLYLIVSCFAALMFASSCGDDAGDSPKKNDVPQDTTPTVVIDSSNGFILGDDQYFVANLSKTNSSVSYDENDNATTINISGTDLDGEPIIINVKFPGQSTGSWMFEDANSTTALSIRKFNNTKLYASDPSDANGKLVVTKYGAVGETIEGTFSGLFKESISSIEVSNGTFKLER